MAIFSVFMGVASAEMVSLPKTGQTTCYDSSGNSINCQGTLQDGDNQSGVAWPSPRFVDNNDGTISDKLTGLMWVKNTATPTFGTCTGGTKIYWSDALSYVSCLNSGNYLGHNDWRLPNWNELESQVNFGVSNMISYISNNGFTNVAYNNYYWSSTTYAGDTNRVWILQLEDYNQAWQYPMYKYYSVFYHPMHAWPVRDDSPGPAKLWATGQKTSYVSSDDGDLEKGAVWPNPRFVDNNDGTVTDKLTGLMWTKTNNIADGNKNWQNAFSYVANMNSGMNENYGYNDWRIPNIKELESLANLSRYNPSLSEGHPFTLTNNVQWSSTNEEYSPNNVWIYSIYDSYRTIYSKTISALVWPVRGFRMKLPLPSEKHWLLTVEAGGQIECNLGTDQYHTNNGYYSLDFVDRNLEDGELTGVSDVPILAAADGTVVTAGDGGGFGWTVVLDHGNGYRTRYAHLRDEPTVSGFVQQGQQLGIMGTTGTSTGIHLHFQVYFNGQSLSTTTQLKSVVLENLYLDEYQVGCRTDNPSTAYYLSTNTQ